MNTKNKGQCLQQLVVSFVLTSMLVLLCGCAAAEQEAPLSPDQTEDSSAYLPNPASVYCEDQGYTLQIRTAEDGSQSGVCIFPDGSECDEWAYFRKECGPGNQAIPSIAPSGEGTSTPTDIPTPMPINSADYQGWWTYTHPEYGFSIMLPEDWVVDDTASGEDLLAGHLLSIHPKDEVSKENIRMTFRETGEEVLLWPTGVGQGEFIPLGTLDISDEPAQRILLVCPEGEITSIWYHQSEGSPNIQRGNLEFGIIFSIGTHCEAGYSLSGKTQYVGEMIIASLIVP